MTETVTCIETLTETHRYVKNTLLQHIYNQNNCDNMETGTNPFLVEFKGNQTGSYFVSLWDCIPKLFKVTFNYIQQARDLNNLSSPD